MNIVLFHADELNRVLPFTDSRAIHITTILKCKIGDSFAAGIIDGPIGEAILKTKNHNGWQIHFQSTKESPLPHPISMLIGCPRPPVARRLIKDLTTMGVEALYFCATDLNEKSYLEAKLWRNNLWHSALIEGGMQGTSTHLPIVRTAIGLDRALEILPDSTQCIVLDNNRKARPISCIKLNANHIILAVGPERGWSKTEYNLLQSRNFIPARLGQRILRTETACTTGVAMVLAHWGIY